MSKLSLEQIFATTIADAKGNAVMPINRVDAICNQLLVMAGLKRQSSNGYYYDNDDPMIAKARKAANDAANAYIQNEGIVAVPSYQPSGCGGLVFSLPKATQKKIEQVWSREYNAIMKTSRVPEIQKQVELLRLALLTGKREQLLPIVKAFQKAFDEINA